MNDKQLVLVNMMKWFHEFCEMQGIKYYAIGGTALGAVRHKGFIPWDDDIDIGVPRQDYERLIHLSKNIIFQNSYRLEFPLQNEDYDYTFGKLYDVNTTLVENFKNGTKRGVYIDIFPLDGLGNGHSKAIKIFNKVNNIKKIFILRYCSSKKRRPFYKQLIIFFVRCLPSFVYRKKHLINRINKLCKINNYQDSLYVGNCLGMWGQKEIMQREWFGVPQLMRFEDIQIYIPENYDKYLTGLYGDYMKLPPEEKRKSHHDYIYENLNKSYLEE